MVLPALVQYIYSRWDREETTWYFCAPSFYFLDTLPCKILSMTTPFLSDAMNPSAADVIKIVHLTPYERLGVIVSQCSEIYDLEITFL